MLRQNAVKKYAYLERCYGSAQIGRQSCLPIRRACEMLNISVSGFYEWRHCDKAHRFGIVETDDFIVQTLKAIIKNSCGGHIPGVLVCYHYLREQGLSIDLKRDSCVKTGCFTVSTANIFKPQIVNMTCSGLPICCNDILMTLASMRLGAAILLTSQQTRAGFT